MAPSYFYVSVGPLLTYYGPAAQLDNSRSVMVQHKHKIMMMPFNSALKTTQKNQVFKYGGQKHYAFVPHPTVPAKLKFFPRFSSQCCSKGRSSKLLYPKRVPETSERKIRRPPLPPKNSVVRNKVHIHMQFQKEQHTVILKILNVSLLFFFWKKIIKDVEENNRDLKKGQLCVYKFCICRFLLFDQLSLMILMGEKYVIYIQVF